jgi:3-dehydrosphinganine reductase
LRSAIQRNLGRDNVGVHATDVHDTNVMACVANLVNVLVSNHGVFMLHELERQDKDEIKLMVNINLMGTFHLM